MPGRVPLSAGSRTTESWLGHACPSSNPQLLEEPIEAPGFVAMQGSADLSGPASLILALPTRAVIWSPHPAPASRLLKSGAVIE
jgi:hypothetical protein